MGIRKNAKFLTPAERENFVKACILLKADIVNPTAPANLRYSKWDAFIAVHWMIQEAFAPGSPSINFGHGGTGAYSFLSWHRYFLFHMEQQLQSKVPGVMLPYWDFTDPTGIMTDTFLGPNGSAGGRVRQGYFAVTRPGTAPNTTPIPPWWPANLDGWLLSDLFPTNARGGLKRSTNAAANTTLPAPADIVALLAKTSYHNFQRALEAGGGIPSGHRLHNDMHKWFGGHMQILQASPFDPFFYLVHCNVDRLWAMWQTDGHAVEYPTTGGNNYHRRNDLMYPWTGGASGYGTNAPIAAAVPMPSWVTAPGAKINSDTLDYRNFGYTYDTLPVMGIGLERSGSMTGLTPDPMITTSPDVTKWEAAKRGVSALLFDAETLKSSGKIYLTAGIKTFRRSSANNFDPVFGAPNFGLIKTGTGFSKSAFDTNINTTVPGGSSPLADALLNVQNTMVEAPFGGQPANERRYLAMFTDGLLTSGAAMNTIPNGGFNRTAVFAMGFGTGAGVNYATLNAMRNKGQVLSTQQVFHGENAGTIDKFYGNSLAAAIGFEPILDPLIELFAGEHTHVYFDATSAEDAFFITAQGLDFTDANWEFMLHGPNGFVLYGNEMGHDHGDACHHCCPSPYITGNRSDGRLALVVERGNTGTNCWVGRWELMIAYKTSEMDGMAMQMLGELMFPVAAGPVRGPRYSRLLNKPDKRQATRNIFTKSLHGLDIRAASSNRNENDACNVLVNVYGRTTLKVTLDLGNPIVKQGEELAIEVNVRALVGNVRDLSGFARMVAPAVDMAHLLPGEKANDIIRKLENEKPEKDEQTGKKCKPELDLALILAQLEKAKEGLEFIRDVEIPVVSHEGGPLHMHIRDTKVPGTYHFGVYIEGIYIPDASPGMSDNDHEHEHGHMDMESTSMDGTVSETFSRLLNISVGVVGSG